MNTIRLSPDDVAKNPMVLKALLKNDPELARSMGLIQDDESKRTPPQEAAIETATQEELRKKRVEEDGKAHVYTTNQTTHGIAYTIEEKSSGRRKHVFRDGSERYEDEV